MKLKLDDQGHVVVQDGKPVYVHDDGKDTIALNAGVRKVSSPDAYRCTKGEGRLATSLIVIPSTFNTAFAFLADASKA
ncbi:hypothetical protein [Pseudomonas rubra]|uniref:Uncharacterized protein n=1 Tax=Pseudomonas rubra TaxID=2942627 RepID=A0ABT5PF12_9PSED|nr:hypothetical protein [Pseudomonas rubra]MDD1016905.1 hypothetical protein [Pseudomonas rubra]MDD1039349.1 hypothetical protein [Pseudomonas rubra]MDD1157869.1 hypothetical protein [Pseudomonas rubra]